MPGEAPFPADILRARLLQCMRRVILAGITLDSDPQPPFIVYRPGETYESGSMDALVVDDLARLAELAPFMAPHAPVYVAHAGGGASLEPFGLTAYIQWPDMTMAVAVDYDPVAHAHALLKTRRVGEAYEVLLNVPADYVDTPERKAALAAESQWCLLAAAVAADARAALNLFYRAQEQFFLATAFAPEHAPSYVCHARHWQCINRADMAKRLLRTARVVAPSPDIDAMLATLTDAQPPDLHETAPDLTINPRGRRILIVSHEGSDYGLDTLYDGLCELLGDEAVVEIPWKPTLHGQHPERAEGYPCVYHRRGEPKPLQEIEAELRAGVYDVVLFADTLKTLDPRGLRQLMNAAQDTPLFILDTWDEGGDYRDDLLAFLGRETCNGYFKREMLAGVDYGPNAYPLCFAYADIDTAPAAPRDRAIFWAGKPAAGLRPAYQHYLRARGIDVDRRFSQEEYRDALRRSRIGLNLFGYGFDTVRYWEVPAHGAMLLSERPPIRIPHNFVDGVHAVFFDDLPDLEEKLDYYLRYPEECAAIAEAGHTHFHQYHTATARARQFLAVVASNLNWS